MIHPTAIVHPGARLAPDVEVGPYTIIGEHVEIGPGTIIGPHAVIAGHTQIGQANRIFQFVSLGEVPQDKKYAGEPTRLEIGDHNTIREFCTFNTGTAQDVGVTRVGHHNWVMAYVHLAHDSQVGDHTVLANMVTLAGHVTVDDHVILGGGAMVHQFCRVGVHAFVAGGSIVLRDVPPYVMAGGSTSAEPHGINSEGLKRRGFGADTIERIRRAYKTLYRSGLSFEEARQAIAEMARETAELRVMVDFLASSTRGVVR
jgi:UDP-N-acetylglucosamine acyltransferase